MSLRRLTISERIELVLRIATVALSCLQFMINHTSQVSQCVIEPDGVLVRERKTLAVLIIVQYLKVIVFSIWSLELVEPDW